MIEKAHRNPKAEITAKFNRAASEAKALARRQAALTRFGQRALAGDELSDLMDEAPAFIARMLRVECCKVLELLPDGQGLLLQAGVGWKEGYVGRARVGVEQDSQAGYTLLSKRPVVTRNLRKERRFKAPPLLVEHNVLSGVSVIIFGRERPFGILGAHSTRERDFNKGEINFVQAVAHILATAIERKRAEEALQRQAQVLDQIHDSVVSTDLDGVITSWNRGATRLFGYTSEEALGRHISFVYGENQRRFLEEKLIHPLKEKGVHQVEVEMLNKRGKKFYAHLSLSLLRNPSGEPAGMIGYSMDITAKKRAEHQLQTANQMLLHEVAERMQAEQVARAHTNVVYRSLRALTAEPDLGKFLDEVMIGLTRELKAHSCALWLHHYATGLSTLYKTAHEGRVLTGLRQLDFPYASQPALTKIKIAAKSRQRKPFLVANPGRSRLLEPEVQAWMTTQNVKSLLCVPLLFRGEVVGTLIIREAGRNQFTSQEVRLARALASHASLALHLIRLAEEGQNAAILKERNRVAREIHDSLGQGLTGIIVQLEAAEDVLAENHQLAMKHLKQAGSLARESLAEAHRSVWALRPHSLEGADIVAALQHLCNEMTVGKQVKVELSLSGTPRPLAPEAELHLLRMAQEALTNALKHGRATSVSLKLTFGTAAVQLSVQDNGRGFKKPYGEPNGGFGKVSLLERAEQIGAKVAVRSRPGFGTVVDVRVPASAISSRETSA